MRRLHPRAFTSPNLLFHLRLQGHVLVVAQCQGQGWRRAWELKTICHLPTLFKDRERAFLRRQASAGNKGDQSIISNAGYALFQEPLYEHFTQPDQLEDELLYADEGYEWDGSHDFSIYPDEEEFDISVEVEDSLSFVWDSDGNVYY